MKKINWISLIILIVASSCSGVKNLTQPELNLPEKIYPNTELDTITIADLGWWEFYGDEYLKEIITEALSNNKELQIAASRVEEAQYQYKVSKADLYPELSFRLPWNHETNDYYKELSLIDPEIGVKATITWEVDLWGKLSWAKKKTKAQFKATEDDERAMRMILVGEIASTYFRLVALDNELEIVKTTMEKRAESVNLAKIRYEGGLTSETVYQQARVQYATAAALIPNLEVNIEVTENALCILMGKYPGYEIKRSSRLKDNTLPDRVPLGVPSTLLERRPDVKASESRLKASMAQVGISYANRFPRLPIELTGGLEDNDFKNLFRSPFSYVAENFIAPLVDFGKRKNAYKASIAAYETSRLSYENKVMQVFEEVDNALIKYKKSREAVLLQTDLLEAASRYQELTWIQYQAGTINYIDVLDAQRRYLEAQIAHTNALRDEHLAMVDLYKALGGGWQLQNNNEIM